MVLKAVNVDEVYNSIAKHGRSDKQVRLHFYNKLQFVVKLQLPVITGTILIWPACVTQYLVGKGHQPSSSRPVAGYVVPIELFNFYEPDNVK